MEKSIPEIQLVITVALKKEVPKDWFESQGVAVHSLAALKSGALKQVACKTGILIIITGAGLSASEEAAYWIRDNLPPLFVLNIGTCGLIDRRYPTGRWLRPRHAANEDGDSLELDTRQPLPCPDDVINIQSVISVRKAYAGNHPDSLRKHDAIDMECYSQAKVFNGTGTSFHCLKFGTDYSDEHALTDFNKNLELFSQATKDLFDFLNIGLPKVSVIVPVYNRGETVKRAIDSVLSQSYMPEEIIVVDDCSTDRTPDILKSYGEKISVLRLQINSGPSAARNAGIRHARNEWTAFLDSDDCWERDKLKKQVEYLRKCPFYQLLQSEEIWIRNGKRVNACKHHKKPLGWIWEQSLERCLVSPSGVLVKKSLLERYGGFDESLPVCEDYDMWLKISRHHPAGLDPALSVIKYGGHQDQLSHRYPAMDRFRVESLARLLKEETHPDFRKKIIDILEKKLKILIQGYEKRQKSDDARYCGKILDSIKEFK
ncbi:MAG: glycosyltransferase [Nitrospirae bacterium]|nr:glycosyltransferase [Nitrospirota bacterium]